MRGRGMLHREHSRVVVGVSSAPREMGRWWGSLQVLKGGAWGMSNSASPASKNGPQK